MNPYDYELREPLSRIASLEAQLLAARDVGRCHCQRLGESTAHLFGESAFVLRETAERWARNAREDAVNDDDALAMAYRRGLRAGRREEREFLMGFIAASGGSLTLRPLEPPKPSESDAQATAGAIIEAGKKRRGEVPPEVPTDPIA
jgi:hypothetical protein